MLSIKQISDVAHVSETTIKTACKQLYNDKEKAIIFRFEPKCYFCIYPLMYCLHMTHKERSQQKNHFEHSDWTIDMMYSLNCDPGFVTGNSWKAKKAWPWMRELTESLKIFSILMVSLFKSEDCIFFSLNITRQCTRSVILIIFVLILNFNQIDTLYFRVWEQNSENVMKKQRCYLFIEFYWNIGVFMIALPKHNHTKAQEKEDKLFWL